MKNTLLIVGGILLFTCGFQGGFIFKCWWDYTRGPVPMITPSEIVGLMENKNG